jgi:MFS family permease
MLLPEFPAYISSLGGADYKGFIISFFTITAGISRPFSGKLTDTIGRVPVMVFGSVVCVISSFCYSLAGTVVAFLILRLFHGFSTGFTPTAVNAYVADISPAKRRGEALAMMSFFGHMGLAGGPVLGGYIVQQYDINTLFYTSTLIAVVATVLLMNMKETLEKPQKFTLLHLKVGKKEIFEPLVKFPALIMLLTIFPFGVILTLIPDVSTHLGIANKGTFFMFYTLASLTSRMVGGRWSDVHGREKVIKYGTATAIIGLFCMIYADTSLFLFLGAVLYGLGSGLSTPAIFAWTIDRGNPDFRGRALATLFIALEIGIGLGAYWGAEIYGNIIGRVPYALGLAAMFSATGLFLIVFEKPIKQMMRSF